MDSSVEKSETRHRYPYRSDILKYRGPESTDNNFYEESLNRLVDFLLKLRMDLATPTWRRKGW
jgi:hypothetical protein